MGKGRERRIRERGGIQRKGGREGRKMRGEGSG